MKKTVDLKALQRELKNRIDVLGQDQQFMRRSDAKPKLDKLMKRMQLAELLEENLDLIDWLVNPETQITRKHLIDQNGV